MEDGSVHQPVSQANSRSIPTPACDTTSAPSALTLTRRDPLLPLKDEVPSRSRTWTPDKSQFLQQDRHFVLSAARVATYTRETSGVALC
jgi:hypothetical protein